MDLSELPKEILPTIFKYLPIDDRKNVRLTSQLLCDACNCFEIVKYEKFLIRFDPNEDDVAEIANGIVNCKKLRPKFEFHGFPLWQLPSFVWERAGNAIEFLHFHDCEMRESTISNIFLNCLNLRSFHLESYRLSHSLAYLFGSEDALDDVIRRKFEQKNLRLLHLYIPVWLTSNMYEKLYQIFPNIQTLGRGPLRFTGDPLPSSSIDFPPKMESFTYKGNYNTSWMLPLCKSNRPNNLKIKEVKIALPEDYEPVVVHTFFSNNTELEKVKLSGSNSVPSSFFRTDSVKMKELLFHLFKSLPNLKEFKFGMLLHDIPLSATEFHYFLRQIEQLETLVLSWLWKHVLHREGQYFILDDSYLSELSPSKIEYTKLKKMKLYFYNEKIYSAILNRCTSSLQYLYLQDLPIDSTNVLTSKHWDFTELKTLRLKFKEGSSIGSFSTTCLPSLIYFVKRLQKLKHLEICGLGSQKYPKNETELDYLAEFDLPLSLKYFYFELVDHAAYAEDVCKLTDIVSHKVPNLEIFRLSYHNFGAPRPRPMHQVEEWLQEKTDLFVNYCQRMKKLKCLIIDPLHPPDHYGAGVQHPVRQVFEACQSLKFVCGYSGNFWPGTFCLVSYDRHAAKYKWYIDHSIPETLEWFPKFGRARRGTRFYA